MMRKLILNSAWTLLTLLHAVYCGVQRSYDLLCCEWLQTEEQIDDVHVVDPEATRHKGQ